MSCMRAPVAALATVVLLLGACGQADTAAKYPTLLQPEDLPPVESVSVESRPLLTKTNCAAMDREYNLAVTGEDDVFLTYVLDGGDMVRSGIQSPQTSQLSIDFTLDEMRRLVGECVKTFEEAADRSPPTGSFHSIDGLEDSAIGFRIVQETSKGPETTERIYARVDDASAAVVTVVHRGNSEPSTDVIELVEKALERARR